ncbi:MAG: hypothetical protein CBC38_08035 [Gammaproteobacteria bacterium TMED78]|nr:MAG: hypothetical protein CBC38_08035 [Gammaproteobacteria bacterium TMED78]|tara:strand:- start:12152 stop:13393 length:1242 start_codon:yes stop_codon:yes gene_type:complete
MLKIYHSFFWILVILISSCSQQTYNNNNSFLKSGQEPFGPYQPSPDWPKDISTIPGYEKWTWGAIQGVFAESADRIFVIQRGLLPKINRPETRFVEDQGTRLLFPVGRNYSWRDNTMPWRDATQASPDHNNDHGWNIWQSAGYIKGVDALWENCVVVINREGDIVETWNQWDSMWVKPHAVHINPYDPDKHVWIVDDFAHAIYKFTNDGKEIIQTLGVPNEPGQDEKHFARPTFMAFSEDAIFVADGYVNSRVIKFDLEGNYLLQWGQEGTLPDDTRPGYFNALHGIDIDPESGRVYVSDRMNNRIQVFDQNGNFIFQWRVGDPPSDVQYLIVSNGALWVMDAGTTKLLKYDLEGNFLNSWGTWGTFSGGMWGVHGMTVDEEGNFYISEVNTGRVQKFTPRTGVNPDYLILKP